MKIALCTHQFPPSIGGMQEWNRQMAIAFAKAGHDVDVYHLKYGVVPHADPHYRYIGVSVDPKAIVEKCDKHRYTLGFLLRLSGFFLRFLPKLFYYDVWHISFGEPALLRLFFHAASYFTRTKIIAASGCVIFRHPYKNAFTRNCMFTLSRSFLKRAALILVDGKDIQTEITEQKVPGERIKICYAGIDANLFAPGSSKVLLYKFAGEKNLSLDPEKPIILYCARFSYENAPLQFLNVLEGMSGVQAVMIGNGVLMPNVNDRRLSLAIPVHLWGTLAYTDLPLVYGSVDVCIYPYSRYIGGISQVIPLSMSCEAAVITTKIGDNEALVAHGVNGFLYDEDDAPGMRAKARELIADVKLRAAIGAAARKTIVGGWRLTDREMDYAGYVQNLMTRHKVSRTD